MSNDADEAWQDLGACVGKSTRLFFPAIENAPVPTANPDEEGEGYEAAVELREKWTADWAKTWSYGKVICGRCEVRDECLAHALSYPERSGLWGGLDPLERRVLLNDRRKTKRAAQERARKKA